MSSPLDFVAPNFRPLQALNGRTVYSNEPSMSRAIIGTSACFRELAHFRIDHCAQLRAAQDVYGVVLRGGKPLSGATVKVVDNCATGTTDVNGYFALDKPLLKSGSGYTLQVRLRCFAPASPMPLFPGCVRVRGCRIAQHWVQRCQQVHHASGERRQVVRKPLGCVLHMHSIEYEMQLCDVFVASAALATSIE